MHVISRKRLLAAGERYGAKASTALESIAKGFQWGNLNDVRQTYSHADGVVVRKGVEKRVYTVFNIAGNDFRLITEIFYDDRTILIRHVLTHSEYDKGDWKR